MTRKRAMFGERQLEPRLCFARNDQQHNSAHYVKKDVEFKAFLRRLRRATLLQLSDDYMTVRTLISQVAGQENLNFLLTNRIPRRWLTLFVGWLSRVRNPFVRDTSIAIWKLFSDLDLSEARKTHFDSLHDCFTRELREGARPVDPDPAVLTSPCDGIIGACGRGERRNGVAGKRVSLLRRRSRR